MKITNINGQNSYQIIRFPDGEEKERGIEPRFVYASDQGLTDYILDFITKKEAKEWIKNYKEVDESFYKIIQLGIKNSC